MRSGAGRRERRLLRGEGPRPGLLVGRRQRLVDVLGQALDLEGQDDAHDADRDRPDAGHCDERGERGAGVGEREDPEWDLQEPRYHIAAKLQADARELPSQLSRATGPLQDVTVKAFGVIGQFVTVLSVAFLLMLNGRRYVGLALRLTGSREARYRQLIVDINQAVARYMLGNVAISLLATVATWLVLTILGVPYALSLAIVVGFFDLIPLVGATIGAIVVAFATVTVDFPTATIVWVAFVIVYQRFENYLVQPLVYGRTLNVNPLVTILGVLAGASLLGILGALLAIPIAAAVQILLRDWWANRGAAAEAS
jgi:predicted PurR-regulated permease PerM